MISASQSPEMLPEGTSQKRAWRGESGQQFEEKNIHPLKIARPQFRIKDGTILTHPIPGAGPSLSSAPPSVFHTRVVGLLGGSLLYYRLFSSPSPSPL